MRGWKLVSLASTGLAAFISLAACSTTNNNGPPGGGGSDAGPVAVVLSNAGESCTRRADCASGLVCVRNVCATGVTSADGGPSAPDAAPPQLSQLGESCSETPDCGPGLVCVANPTLSQGSVCDLANFGLTPTGKTCSGECNVTTDCCELPLGLTVPTPTVKIGRAHV